MGNNCCNPDNDNKDSLKTDGETMQIGHDANYDRQEKQVSSQPGLESTKPSPNVAELVHESEMNRENDVVLQVMQKKGDFEIRVYSKANQDSNLPE